MTQHAWLELAESTHCFSFGYELGKDGATPIEAFLGGDFPRVRFIRGPADPELVAQAHARGIAVVPYISFMGSSYESSSPWPPALKERPELAIFDRRGVRQRCIFADGGPGDRCEVCPNCSGVVEGAVAAARRMAQTGVDGFFIDCAFGYEPCHGAELGIHEHLYTDKDLQGIAREELKFVPDADTADDDPLGLFALAQLLARVREATADIRPDLALIANTTYWPFHYSASPIRKNVMFEPGFRRRTPRVLWEQLDAEMVESFMVVPRSLVDAESDARTTQRWQKWEAWQQAITLPPDLAATKRQIALPYFGTDGARDTAFLVYAAAKLGNAIWEASWRAAGREFIGLELGPPAGEVVQQGEALVRRFQRGAVAVNPTDRPAEVDIDLGVSEVLDLHAAQHVRLSGERVQTSVPAHGGRVWQQEGPPLW